jgi:hypothetical protein
VEAQNSNGRSAGLSNQVWVPLAPTWPPPVNVTPQVTADGVRISWSTLPASGSDLPSAVSSRYVVYREAVETAPAVNSQQNALNPMAPNRAAPAHPVIIAEVRAGQSAEASVLDRNVEWEKTYRYTVGTVTTVITPSGLAMEVPGGQSAPAEVFVHDIFPPAQPTGVEAVFSAVGGQRSIDLTWSPNMDSDLAGYNVYRREGNTSTLRINRDLIKAPSFRDMNVEPAHQYWYSVSAVDRRGNESARSAEAQEMVPSQQ